MLDVPQLYYQMDQRGMLDYRSKNYLWVFDMRWIPVSKLSAHQDIVSQDTALTAFARGMGGDYWCFKKNADVSDWAVCLCERTEDYGTYFAGSLPDAIFREIIFYCGTACFDDEPTVEANEWMLKKQLMLYADCLNGIFNQRQIDVIKDLTKRSLTLQTSQYGQWMALLSEIEVAQIVDSTINLSKMDSTFPIRWLDE